MGETFSQSQDIAGDMGSCFNGEKLLEGQDSLVETCIVIEKSNLVQLFRNAYKIRIQHQL